MKIFIIPSWYPSNLHPESGTFFQERAAILQQGGHDVTMIVSLLHSFRDIRHYFTLPGTPEVSVDSYGLKTYRQERISLYPKMPKLSFRQYKKQLVRLLDQVISEEDMPEMVIANSSFGAGIVAAGYFPSDIPLIFTEHLKEFLLHDGFTSDQFQHIEQGYHRANKVITPSMALRNGIVGKFAIPPEKITVIPNPVWEPVYADASTDIMVTIGFQFITVALLREEKRLDILIRAFAKVQKQQSDTRLIIVGNGPEELKLKSLAHQLGISGKIVFAGYKSPQEISVLLAKSDGFVLSSEVETFGVVLGEAMISGLPVVATRCGGPEDMVTKETGILVPVNDETALGEGMLNLIQNREQFDSGRIREYAKTQFGTDAYLQRMERVFSKVRKTS